MPIENVVVLGAGAMGSLYASLLAPFVKVTILDEWIEQVRAINAQGLTLTGIGGVLRPALQARSYAEVDVIANTADLAIALVNAGDSPRAAQVAQVALKKEGFLLTLQNGVGNIEAFSEALSPDRVTAGLSYHSAAIRNVASVEHTHRGPTWVGELDGRSTPRMAELVSVLSAAGGEPKLVDDIVSHVWTKFIHNCAINAVCAASGLRVGEIPSTPGADELQTKVIEEALRVVAAKGIRLADPDPMTSIKAFCRVKFNKPSMLQHMEASRETEIDALNGAVVREGAVMGIPTPYNEALTWVIRSMQHHRIKMLREPAMDYEELERSAKKAAS